MRVVEQICQWWGIAVVKEGKTVWCELPSAPGGGRVRQGRTGSSPITSTNPA